MSPEFTRPPPIPCPVTIALRKISDDCAVAWYRNRPSIIYPAHHLTDTEILEIRMLLTQHGCTVAVIRDCDVERDVILRVEYTDKICNFSY